MFPIEARATLAYKRGSTDEALALYDHSFQPLWPPELVQDYFTLLKETHRLREFLSRARAAVTANPSDVARCGAPLLLLPATRQSRRSAARAGRLSAAHGEDERRLERRATLDARAPLATASTRITKRRACYYALYSLPGAEPALQEKALAGIAKLLLSAPEQPIEFGNNSISFLRDIGSMDPYPGFLNGILSLLLNSQSPAFQYSQAEGTCRRVFPSRARRRTRRAVRQALSAVGRAQRTPRQPAGCLCRLRAWMMPSCEKAASS